MQQCTQAFKAKFLRRVGLESALIGIESEFPLVDKEGNAALKEIVVKAFNHFKKKGWKAVIDSGTKQIVGVTKRINGFDVAFGTDVGDRIIEVALPPAKTLFDALRYRSKILKPIVKFFNKHDTYLLGYGILPKEQPHKNLMANKGRYIFLEQDSGNTFVPKKQGVDLHVFTLPTASQTHIQVDRNNAINAMNVLNALSGVFLFLGANSPIWQGDIHSKGIRAIREWLWEVGWPTRPNQIGMLKPIKNFEAYINHLASFKPQMVKRGYEYFSLLNTTKTFADLLVKKNVTAKTVKGEKIDIEIKLDDICFVGGFAWHNARITSYGTVESRICCQQLPSEPLAISALTLGLISNLKKSNKLIKKKNFLFWKKLRRTALISRLENHDHYVLSKDVLTIAKEGLKKRNHGEEIFLEPLFKRLKDKKAPADDIIKHFNKGGINSLVEFTMITLASLI
ncbi:hypothetical protein HY357_02050 [Candidatus Roizmanbacteria bacterium]|nr:hypothetical protein [Candidatus Roizmanbacteria bacterium]